MRGRISPKTSNASFWIGPKGWRGERNVLNRLAPLSISRGAKIRSTLRHTCRRRARTGSNRVGASCARGASAKGIFQLALAVRARGDVGFDRGNLVRRQDLQG